MKKGLSQPVLGRAALELLDAEGVAALTMRRLAARLGVDPMAAYRHVRDKDELLVLAMEQLLSEVQLDDLTGPPVAQLRAGVRRVYDVMRRHAGAAPILSAQQWTTPAGMAIVEWGMRLLTEAGRSPAEAVRMMNATGLFLVGLASASTSTDAPRFVPERHPVTVAALGRGDGLSDYGELLEFWLDALLAT